MKSSLKPVIFIIFTISLVRRAHCYELTPVTEAILGVFYSSEALSEIKSNRKELGWVPENDQMLRLEFGSLFDENQKPPFEKVQQAKRIVARYLKRLVERVDSEGLLRFERILVQQLIDHPEMKIVWDLSEPGGRAGYVPDFENPINKDGSLNQRLTIYFNSLSSRTADKKLKYQNHSPVMVFRHELAHSRFDFNNGSVFHQKSEMNSTLRHLASELLANAHGLEDWEKAWEQVTYNNPRFLEISHKLGVIEPDGAYLHEVTKCSDALRFLVKSSRTVDPAN